MTKIIYPLLAGSFRFLGGPVCYLSEDHYLAQINETDFGIVLTTCPGDYRGVLAGRFRCVYYDADDAISDDQILQNGQLIAFTLNYFSSLDALYFPFAIKIEKSGRKSRALFKFEKQNQVLGSPSALNYRLMQGTTVGELQKLFSLANAALRAAPRARLMITRFNSALRRSELEDKIIDLSVALETMLDDTAEISFKLSLYLAFICQQDKSAAYELFRSFYDVRSRIVHGSLHQQRAQRGVEEIGQRMPEVIKFSKTAMLYYFSFLSLREPAEWGKHCLGLVLGSEQQIV
jgi:hypothetical protein